MTDIAVSAASYTINPITKPPVTNRPPRRTSKEQMHNNVNQLSVIKRKRNVSYQKDDSFFGNSLDIEKNNVERSLSWGNLTQLSLTDNQRSLSASNLYALHDPDLSIKAAISKKPYDKPHTSFSKEKAVFTAWTQKYYYQLTIGCGNKQCQNMFCRSSPQMKSFDSKMISLISIELAGYKNHYLCVKDKKKQAAKVLDPDCFKVNLTTDLASDNQVPFLYRFYSMSPFRSLFLPCPLTPSGLGLHRTHSHSELHTPVKTKTDSNVLESNLTNTFKNHLSSITSTISSSVSNIFQYANKTEARHEEERSKISQEVNQESESLQDDDEELKTPKRGERFYTRQRIPSVRIFGDEHAVDTKLELQDNIDEFEMSVAAEFREDSIYDFEDSVLSDEELSGGNEDGEAADGYSLTHLTLDMFRKILFNYSECGDETFLLNTLRTVFASWDALMMSFQNEGISKEKRHPFNVKLSDVIDMFTLLEEVDKNDKFRVLLTDTIQVMLLKRQSIKDAKELKPLVIILVIPSLFKYSDVVHELSAVISRLSSECIASLSSYIADCFTKQQLGYLVDVSIFFFFFNIGYKL